MANWNDILEDAGEMLLIVGSRQPEVCHIISFNAIKGREYVGKALEFVFVRFWDDEISFTSFPCERLSRDRDPTKYDLPQSSAPRLVEQSLFCP